MQYTCDSNRALISILDESMYENRYLKSFEQAAGAITQSMRSAHASRCGPSSSEFSTNEHDAAACEATSGARLRALFSYTE